MATTTNTNPDPTAVTTALIPLALPVQTTTRRLPPPCWSHDETLSLISIYKSKWLSLRRGNLRAVHWQELSDSLNHLTSNPKTSLQCRHKIEKLRKRYRSEKLRPHSSWPFFPLLHSIQFDNNNTNHTNTINTNTNKLFVAPAEMHLSSDSESGSDSDISVPTRSLQNLMSNGGPAGMRFRMPAPIAQEPRFVRKEKRGRSGVGELVEALKGMGERFMRTEQMKMEMEREMEKVRMEMELKRTEMVLDSQRRIVDAFVKGVFGRKKKKSKRVKVSPDGRME